MAEMYKELSSEWGLKVSGGERIGTRGFLRNDENGTIAKASLPTLGSSVMTDQDGNTLTGCKARYYEVKYAAAHGSSPIRVYHYSTSPRSGGGQPGATVNDNTDDRRFEVGGESVSIEDSGSGWEWASDSDVCDQPLYKQIVTGSLTRTKRITAANWSAFLSTVISLAGKINDDTFEGFSAGQVLFTGISGGTETDEAGATQYAIELHFQFRLIDDDAISSNDWLYIWRKEDAGWDQPRTKGGGASGDYLYDSGDFDTLFT